MKCKKILVSALGAMSMLSFQACASTLSVGVGGALFELPYKGMSKQTIPFPVINYETDEFSIGVLGGAYHLAQSSDYSIDLTLSAGEYFLLAEDSTDEDIKELSDKGFSVYSGVKYTSFGAWGVASVSLEQDITFQSKGQRILGSYSHPIQITNKITLIPSVDTTVLSSEIVDYYFDDNSGSFESKGGVNFGVGVGFNYLLSQKTNLTIMYRYSTLGSSITDSELVDKSNSTNMFIMLTHIL